MTTKKVRNIKDKREQKEAGKVKIKNVMFENFIPSGRGSHSMSIAKLKLNTSGKRAYELHKWIKRITESTEAKAYAERRDEILRGFEESQAELKPEERRPPMPENVPEWQELLEMDSGLELQKMEISTETFPDFRDPDRALNVFDMEILENYFVLV